MHARTSLTLSMLVLAAGHAGAQILLPPPPPPAEQPVYTPPPPPVTRNTVRTDEAAQRQAQTRALNRTAQAPSVPYRLPSRPIELAPTDAYDGPVLRYDEPMDIVTVRFNPLITPEIATALQALLAERRLALETAVIDNLDAMVNVRGGMIEAASIQDMAGMKAVTDAIEPLRIREPMLDAAVVREIITRPARALHDKIMREYQQALSQEVGKDNPNGVTDFWFQFVLRDGVREAELAYEALLAEAATRAGAVLASAALPQDAAAPFAAITADPSAVANDAEARREAAARVELALRPLTIEQRQAILRAVVASRAEGASALPVLLRTDRPEFTQAEIDNATRPINANAEQGSSTGG